MPNKFETLDSLTHSKISNNNDIRFLPSGGESYQIRWRLLDQARHSIHIATFSMMKDETTQRLEAVLAAKLKEGVKVRIILDEIVNRTTFAGPMIKRLKAAGALVHAYNGLLDEWLPLPNAIYQNAPIFQRLLSEPLQRSVPSGSGQKRFLLQPWER